MKAIKIGLAALAALMAMAFAGASSTMAESTSLCTADGSGCGITHVHETTLSGAKAKLLAGLITVSCDVLFLGDTLSATGSPLVIHGNFTYTECGSCTVEQLEGGEATLEILKEGHETAKVTGEGVVFFDCGGIALECEFDHEGLVGTAKGPLLSGETNGSVTITNQVVHKHAGGGPLCPNESKLDIVTTPLSATYIASSGGGELLYCVDYEHNTNGFYKDPECIKGPEAGNLYDLMEGPAGQVVGQLVCVEMLTGGLWEEEVSLEECKKDAASLKGGKYEMGKITAVY